MRADIVLDWKDGKMVGLEVLDPASLLHADLLAQAIRWRRSVVSSLNGISGRRPERSASRSSHGMLRARGLRSAGRGCAGGCTGASGTFS
jgi:hypothetical protein